MNSARFDHAATVIGWLLVLCLGAGSVPAAERPFEIVEIAPGIYLHRGQHEDMTPRNLGDIANIGFIVGTRAVAVIDPGGSPRIGAELRAAIRAQTRLPITHVILTHAHPDHIFGGSAFEDADHVVAHRNYTRALTQRGEFYRNRFASQLGDATLSLEPNLPVADELEIDLGGRRLRVRAHATAHSDNDLSVFDDATRTLWASDLVFAQRIPALDGSLTGWLEVMDELAAMDSALVIPGHGEPAPWPVISRDQYRYLGVLLRETRRIVAANGRLAEAVESVGAGERDKWILFELHHAGNVSRAYTELEWE